MSVKKILIVEDDMDYRGRLVDACEEILCIEVLEARSSSEAQEIFNQHQKSLDAIIMDGCVDSPDDLDSPPLIEAIRQAGFQKLIVAHSSSKENIDAMIAAGANYGVEKGKLGFVLRILRDQPVS